MMQHHHKASFSLFLLALNLSAIADSTSLVGDSCLAAGPNLDDLLPSFQGQEEHHQDETSSVDCRDEDSQCELWASEGHCDSANAKFVKTMCRKSCPNVCDAGEFDWGEPQEANDIETQYVLAQTLEYLHTVVYADPKYENVRSSCKNKHPQCAYWASIGECNANERFMKYECAPSCQSCGLLDYSIRCQWDPQAPPSVGPGDLDKMFERITTDPTWQKYNPTILSQPSSDAEKDGPWVVLLDNFVSEKESEMLIDAGGVRGYDRSEGGSHVDDETGVYHSAVSDYRTSFQTWCLGDCYQDPISQRVSQRIANITGIPQQYSEYLQLLKYEEGQYYKAHSDFIDHHVTRPMGPRILTFYMYLNDTPEGGGTRFPNLGGLTVTPKRGRAVLWPSVLNEDPFTMDPRTDHEALPVIKGKKYGANAWLHLGDFKEAYAINCSD